ncbi:MAG: AsnC family transcriptional regulator [Candidatus Bathyarchaeia archaeon]
MSSPEDFKWMIKYMKLLDPVNGKILDGLGRYGPRNISYLAKSISVPFTTVTFRLKKLMNRASLRIKAKLDYSKLGLMKGAIFAEAHPKNSEKLAKLIENTDYWSYVSNCYGKFNGVYAIFAFPAKQKAELEKYFAEASRLDILSNYLFFWTTNLWEGRPNWQFFDFKMRQWNFRWDGWIEQVLNDSGEMPKNIEDPHAYPILVDEMDLLILKELEKDGTADFRKIAKVAGVTPQSIRYRFYNHAIERGLLCEYEISILPYPPDVSDMCAFVFDFVDEKALAKFTNCLQGKPFVLSYAKIIGRNSLLVNTYIPKKEFSSLIQCLNKLTQKEILQNFFYVTLDIRSYKRQTISYEFFKNGDWTYNSEEKLRRLKEIRGV